MIFDTKKLKTPAYTAILFGFFGGLVIHLFGLVTVIHNSDDIHCQPNGYGAGVTSGRWFLTFLGKLLKADNLNYNLGLFNGLIFIGFLAVSAGFLVLVFNIKHRQTAALLSLILVSYPTACSTLLYKYTSGFYGLSFFFSILAVWVLPKYKLGGLFLSACFTALSLGIYQAYLPFTASIFVLQLCQQTVSEDIGFSQLLRRGIYACLSMILGLALYFAITRLSLAHYHTTLNSYQGINNMGKIALSDLPVLIGNAYRRFFTLPFSDYCNLATNKLLKTVYLLLYIINIALLILVLRVKKKRTGNVIMAILLYAIFPVAINFIEIMCPTGRIYTLMVYSCVITAFIPIVLLEQLPHPHKLITKTISAVLLVFIISNTYFNNLTYTSLYYVNRQTENYMTSMVAQIRMTEGFSVDKKWAFIGTNSDPMVNNKWQSVPVYGGAEHTNRMISAYSWKGWISHYLGYSIPIAGNEAVDTVKQTQDFQEMSCWPNDNSIRIINDIIVIKFQEES